MPLPCRTHPLRRPPSGRNRPATWAMGSLFEHLLSADESGGLGVSLVTHRRASRRRCTGTPMRTRRSSSSTGR